jgi:hypothetical protein
MCGMLQVSPAVLCRSLIALLDILNRFGGRNPNLRIQIVDRRLYALGIVLGKKPQMFLSHFNLRPRSTSWEN